eukprot:PhF_6_TR31459/c0_g1_i2/m.46174
MRSQLKRTQSPTTKRLAKRNNRNQLLTVTSLLPKPNQRPTAKSLPKPNQRPTAKSLPKRNNRNRLPTTKSLPKKYHRNQLSTTKNLVKRNQLPTVKSLAKKRHQNRRFHFGIYTSTETPRTQHSWCSASSEVLQTA